MCKRLSGDLKRTKLLDSIFIIYKMTKSLLFNLLMLILGFILGFGYVTSKDHMMILESSREQSIEKIKECLDRHIEINKTMKAEFDKLLLFKENIQK